MVIFLNKLLDLHEKCVFFKVQKTLLDIFRVVTVQCLHQGFHQVWYQGSVKATVSGVLENLTFKISEGSDKIEAVLNVRASGGIPH